MSFLKRAWTAASGLLGHFLPPQKIEDARKAARVQSKTATRTARRGASTITQQLYGKLVSVINCEKIKNRLKDSSLTEDEKKQLALELTQHAFARLAAAHVVTVLFAICTRVGAAFASYYGKKDQLTFDDAVIGQVIKEIANECLSRARKVIEALYQEFQTEEVFVETFYSLVLNIDESLSRWLHLLLAPFDSSALRDILASEELHIIVDDLVKAGLRPIVFLLGQRDYPATALKMMPKLASVLLQEHNQRELATNINLSDDLDTLVLVIVYALHTQQ